MSESVVYAVAAEHMVKIGFTTDLARRMREIQSTSPLRIDCLGTAPGGRALESALHRQFAGARQHGEWFELTGVERTELRARLAGEPYFVKLPRAGKREMLGRPKRSKYAKRKIPRVSCPENPPTSETRSRG